MKKLTLKFKDKKIEKQYLQYKSEYFQYPVLAYGTIGGCLLLLINLIVHIVFGNYVNVFKNGIIALYLIGQLLFLRKFYRFRTYSNVAMMITNFSLLIFEADNSNLSQVNYFDGYLLGGNQMLAHIMMMVTNNLNLGMFSNVALTTIRIILVYINGFELNVQQFVYTIIISLSFLVMQIEIDKQLRKQFLLTLKDSIWGINYYILERMIPLILQKPFFLFSFNKEENAYREQSAYKKEFFLSETPLTTFLHQAMVFPNVCLSTYISQERQKQLNYKEKKDYIFNQNINVQYRQKKLLISILACQFEKTLYSIVIQSEDPIIQEQKLHFENHIKQCQTLIVKQITPITTIIGILLKEQYHPLLYTLRISLLEVYYQQTFVSELKIVKVKKLLQKCVKLFQTPQKSIIIMCDDNIKFVTIKNALIIFLFELFKSSNKKNSTIVEINEHSKISLQITGIKQLPNTQLFKRSYQMLVEKIVRHQNGWFFLLFKTPQINFESINYFT